MNILIKNIGIITENFENSYIKNGNIGICDGRIEFIGESEEELKFFKADKIIDGKNKLAMPGLVNAHCHSPMGILRNYADDLALEEWLFGKIIPTEALFTPEDVYWGSMLGILEMLKSGVTCFADMYLHMDEVARAVSESGIRANISKGPLVSGFRGKQGISVDVEGCTEFFKNWNNKANGRIKTSVEIHSVYLYNEETLREAAALAKQLNSGIHIHVLETKTEQENMLKQYGKSTAELCLEFGIFDVPVIAAHCVHLTDEDMAILKNKGVNAVHCPSSNLKLGSGIARIPQMLDLGINVCLGTDGAASNNNLNLFEEMHLSALIHKGANLNPLLVNAGQTIKMATVNGAASLGFGAETGRLVKGRKADLILLDMDKPHLCPMNNPFSAVCYSAQASDVDTVLVDGAILMENRKMSMLDEEKIMYQVNHLAGRVLK